MKKGIIIAVAALVPIFTKAMQQSELVVDDTTIGIVVILNKTRLDEFDTAFERQLEHLKAIYRAQREEVEKVNKKWARQIVETTRNKKSTGGLLNIMAGKSEYFNILRYMLNNGANPNETYHGITPLARAALGSAYCNVELLLGRGASIDALQMGKAERDEIVKAIVRDPKLRGLIKLHW